MYNAVPDNTKRTEHPTTVMIFLFLSFLKIRISVAIIKAMQAGARNKVYPITIKLTGTKIQINQRKVRYDFILDSFGFLYKLRIKSVIIKMKNRKAMR